MEIVEQGMEDNEEALTSGVLKCDPVFIINAEHNYCSDQVQNVENTVSTEKENTLQNINLSNITVPPVFRKRGRPAGTNLTAIGLPSKRKRKLVPFTKLPKHERIDHILS